MHYFYGQRFFNGPDTDERSRALIRSFIDSKPNCSLYIITSVDKRKTGYWEKLLEEAGLNVDVTVDSWFRLSHYKDVAGAHFIFDGDQIYSRANWTRDFLYITSKNNSWDAAADYTDAWVNYMPLFVACGFYKNNTEFQREHIVLKKYVRYPIIDSYIDVDRLRDNLDKIRIQPPYQRGRTDS